MKQNSTYTKITFVMKRTLLLLLVSISLVAFGRKNHENRGYVVVTDYVKADGKKDVSDALQKIIDTHPNRTIYFPDGVYLIGKPILTPADPAKSVALELSNYAILRATPDWSDTEAMVRLGAKDAANNITLPGSNYYLDGGIIDGNKVANGISIDGGRETVIRNTSIKGVKVGIHVKHGANSGSSDADIHDVNIVGDFTSESIGVLVEGYDNTFTNMRIAGVNIGVKLLSSGNSMRNIHPLFYNSREGYEKSCGFWDERSDNWYSFCYSDQFATGFYNKGGRVFYTDCFVYWYSNQGEKHTAIRVDGRFNARVTNLNVGFAKHNATKENVVLHVREEGGKGTMLNTVICDPSLVTDHTHEQYTR